MADKRDADERDAGHPLHWQGHCSRCKKPLEVVGLFAWHYRNGMTPACANCLDIVHPPDKAPAVRPGA